MIETKEITSFKSSSPTKLREISPKRKASDAEYVTTTTTTTVIKGQETSPRRKGSETEFSSKQARNIVTETRTTTAPKSKVIGVEPKKDEKPVWATGNVLKRASETSRTLKTSSTVTKKSENVTDSITSSYGVGPTDENGLPLFGIRALKKKPESSTTVTGTIVTETLYSENGAPMTGERHTTTYTSDGKDLTEFESSQRKKSLSEVREKLLERENSRKGGYSVTTKTEKIGDSAILDPTKPSNAKVVRKGSVKELTEKFVQKECQSHCATTDKSYPKAGLILRTTKSSSRASTPGSLRSGSVDMEETDIEIIFL